jgi:hypothetical protein
MICKAYRPEHAIAWNNFVENSRNGIFLFKREYMDYHMDRFRDYSIWIMNDDEPLALLPANIVDRTVYSHGGLTFGSLVLSRKVGAEVVLHIFECVREYLSSQGVLRWIYKPVPHIYHTAPSEDDIYALFRVQARLIRVDVSTTISQNNRLPLAKGRIHGLKKARKAEIEIYKSRDYTSCWGLLTEHLAIRHGATPTHTLAEITSLAERNPEIQLYMAYQHSEPLAAVVIYDYQRVAHTQYIATSEKGRAMGALDLLLETLISDTYAHRPYFNFGISTENQGLAINTGLCAQKEMFGGRSTIQQWFEIECV